MRAEEKIWTWSEYLKMPSDRRYEIISGRLYEMPSPTTKHQRVVFKIARELAQYVEERDLGEVYISPIDVVFGESDVVQPDIVFVGRENRGIVKEWIMGVPDMVMEVVSPGTLTKDTEIKKTLYERYGVREFWVVFPEERAVQVWVMGEEGRYILYSSAEIEGEIRSKIFDTTFDISKWF